jgi:hypothetical protein
MIQVLLLKRRKKEVKVDPKLGGQWNVPSLVAIGMFHAWWPLECSKFGGHWNVPTWWPMEGERKTHFHLFHFPPINLLTPSFFFPLALRFYFTMVLSRYSRLFFLFFNL